METMAISKFKATCLAVLQRIKRTGRPVLITRFGEPVAEVVPTTTLPPALAWLGCMEGRAEERGNVVAPAIEPRAWRVLGRR